MPEKRTPYRIDCLILTYVACLAIPTNLHSTYEHPHPIATTQPQRPGEGGAYAEYFGLSSIQLKRVGMGGGTFCCCRREHHLLAK